MKHLVVMLLACLTACDRDSLGSFDENRRMTIAGNCWATGSSVYQYAEPDFRCTFDLFASDLEPVRVECPCAGRATLTRRGNGTDAQLLQIQIDHCPHDVARRAIANHLHWLLTAEQLSWLSSDLDEPGRLTNSSMLRGNAALVSATGVYGDRAVEIEWSRDNYVQADGTVEPQSTESYFVAIRPKTWSDLPHGRASKDPRITAIPRCPR